MSETKWTKGPWVMEPTSGGDKEIFISDNRGDPWERLQCTVSRDDCDSDMAIANAHLIISAPDLYAALDSFVRAAESWHKFHNHEGSLVQCDALCACIPSGNAALAKARGEA